MELLHYFNHQNLRKQQLLCLKMHRVKLAIVHNTIAPYRHPLFEALSQDLDLMVYYCSVRHSSREWDLWPRNYDYKYKILPRIPFKTSLGSNSLNPSIITELVLDKPHVIMLSSYTDPTTWLALAVAKLLKIPLIYWTEGIKEPESILGIITKPIRSLFAITSDACLAQGNRTKEYLESLGVDNASIFIAHNCVDNELLIDWSQQFKKKKNLLRKQLNFHEKHLVLFVGQLIPRKGVFDLMRIYEKVVQKRRETGLIVLGSGPLKSQLLSIVSKNKLINVHFVESGISLSELVKYYSIVDLLVLPTLFDLAPLVLNEAMACGLPIVVYNAAGNAYELVIPGVNGEVIETGDVEIFSEAIVRIISDEKLRKKMSKESIRIITSVSSVDSTTTGFLKAIEYVLKK